MKKPYTNPAIYVLYGLYQSVLLYFFLFKGYQNVTYPIPLSIMVIGIGGYISFYFLRPLYPIKIENGQIIISINFIYKKVIDLKTITSIEQYNRYDRLVITTNRRKYSIFFLLKTDGIIKKVKNHKR